MPLRAIADRHPRLGTGSIALETSGIVGGPAGELGWRCRPRSGDVTLARMESRSRTSAERDRARRNRPRDRSRRCPSEDRRRRAFTLPLMARWLIYREERTGRRGGPVTTTVEGAGRAIDPSTGGPVDPRGNETPRGRPLDPLSEVERKDVSKTGRIEIYQAIAVADRHRGLVTSARTATSRTLRLDVAAPATPAHVRRRGCPSGLRPDRQY